MGRIEGSFLPLSHVFDGVKLRLNIYVQSQENKYGSCPSGALVGTWSPSPGAGASAHLCLSCQRGLAALELGSDTFGVHGMKANPLFPTPQVAGKLRKPQGCAGTSHHDTDQPSGRSRGREQGREHRQPGRPPAFTMRWQPR